MKRRVNKTDVVGRLAQLAFDRGNDAVKLLYLEPEDLEGLEKLDLRHLAELKRGANGSVEMKFTSRLELLQLLTNLLENESSGAASLVSALDGAAAALGKKAHGN